MVFGSVPPLLIVATLGYAVLGSVAVWFRQARNWTQRKQAEPDAPS
jgi:hypothetical protein